MADPTLYLFDGHNLLHAGGFADLRELRDTLASWVATQGARGVLVFDGTGHDETRGPLEVRFAEHADSLIERLASENRDRERVCVVSTDSTLRATAGRMVKSVTSQTFVRDLEPVRHAEGKRSELADRLDDETRARLEGLRRGTRERARMNPHVAVTTLGVRDLERARTFYSEGLGWPIAQEDHNWVCFILGGGSTAFALYPWDELASDADVPADGSGFRGVTLSYNVRSEGRVDEVLREAERAGGTIVKPAGRAEWGGYRGYFADTEGFLWEVATGATQLPFSE
jgi:uncharacterized protein